MAMATGVQATIASQQVFVQNGRSFNDWSMERNGFCLLSRQPMPVKQSVLEESPGVFAARPHLFRVIDSSEVELVNSVCEGAEPPFIHYYKEIAKAAKETFPNAEYVVINGHLSFAANASPFAQIAALLGPAIRGGLSRLLSKISPFSSRVTDSDQPKESKVPLFGAVKDFLHVDISSDDGSKYLRSSLNDVLPIKGARLELPNGVLSEHGKERHVVSANFWRNLREEEPIRNNHLAVLDGQTVSEDEVAQTKFKNYAIGGQEQHRLGSVSQKHKLVYFPEMTQDEILVFKQGAYIIRKVVGDDSFDVLPAPNQHSNYIFHTGFTDPTAPNDALPRKSVVCAGVQIIMKEVDIKAPISKI